MRRREKEEGYSLVVIAAVLVVFLGFTALSIDVGVLYSARASAQRAADAAALAGAFVFVTRGDLDETTTPKQSDVIKAQAVSTAATNKMLGAPVTIATSDVTVDTANHLVTVQVNQTQPTLFARVLGENSANIHATAIAEAASTANATGCLKPFFIPNTALSPSDPCTTCWGADGTPGTADDPVTKQVLVEKVGANWQVTSWAQQRIRDSTTANKLNQFSLKPQDPHNALRPGDFFLIDIQGDDNTKIAASISTCITGATCGNTYSILTGNKVGPVRQGIQDLIGCSGTPDVYVAAGQYRHADNTVSSTSRSLVACPVWDVCNANFGGQAFCPTGDVPGGTTPLVQIVGFALVFVEGFTSGGTGPPDCNGTTVVARVINIAACGSTGGGTIDPGETGPFGVPIRLVRAP